MNQTNSKFKVFSGQLNNQNDISPVGNQVAEFVNSLSIVPNSISAQYDNSDKNLVISLGYSESPIPIENNVKMELASVGMTDIKGNDFSQVEANMEAASAKYGNVIAHGHFFNDVETMLVLMIG